MLSSRVGTAADGEDTFAKVGTRLAIQIPVLILTPQAGQLLDA